MESSRVTPKQRQNTSEGSLETLTHRNGVFVWLDLVSGEGRSEDVRQGRVSEREEKREEPKRERPTHVVRRSSRF